MQTQSLQLMSAFCCGVLPCTLLCGSVALTCLLLWRQVRTSWALSAFPGPKPRFLLGNLDMLFPKGCPAGLPLPLCQLQFLLYKQYGHMARFAMGSTPVLFISGAAATMHATARIHPEKRSNTLSTRPRTPST